MLFANLRIRNMFFSFFNIKFTLTKNNIFNLFSKIFLKSFINYIFINININENNRIIY